MQIDKWKKSWWTLQDWRFLKLVGHCSLLSPASMHAVIKCHRFVWCNAGLHWRHIALDVTGWNRKALRHDCKWSAKLKVQIRHRWTLKWVWNSVKLKDQHHLGDNKEIWLYQGEYTYAGLHPQPVSACWKMACREWPEPAARAGRKGCDVTLISSMWLK